MRQYNVLAEMWCLGNSRCVTPKYAPRAKLSPSSARNSQGLTKAPESVPASQIRFPQCWNPASSILPGQGGVLRTTGNQKLFSEDFRSEAVGQRNVRVLSHHGPSNGEDARTEWSTAAGGR